MSETNTVIVGDREFELGRPPAYVYLHLLRLVRSVYSKGLEKLRAELGVAEDADLNAALEQVEELDLLLAAVGVLDVEDLNMLGAILLQFESLGKGTKFVRDQGGFDITWGLEALAIALECAEFDRIKANFRRVLRAIRSVQGRQAETTTEESDDSQPDTDAS